MADDLGKLYETLWEVIESMGDNLSYAQVVGTLEVIKAEVLEEAMKIRDELADEE